MKSRILFLVLISSYLSSCTKVLDITPDGRTSMEEALSTNAGTGAFLNRCYANIPQLGYNWFYFGDTPTAVSDEAYSAKEYNGVMGHYYGGQSSADYHDLSGVGDGIQQAANLGDQWNRNYQQIRLCTDFIERIGTATVTKESDRAKWKAEAHILRAFFYLQLIQWYGKVPLLTRVYGADDDFSKLVRNNVYEVAKYIVADCDLALNTDDSNFGGEAWRITSGQTERQRVTKALACFIKAKAMLFAASPLNEGEAHWEEAYQIAKKSYEDVAAHGYKLYSQVQNKLEYGSDKGAAYREYFNEPYNCTAADVDHETIWQNARRFATFSSWFADGLCWIGGRGTNYMIGECPSQELVDAYEVVAYENNDPAKKIVSARPLLDPARPYLDRETHLQPNFHRDISLNTTSGTYTYDERSSGVPVNLKNTNPYGPYWNRDPRMSESISTNDSQIQGDPFGDNSFVEAYLGGREELRLATNNPMNTKTGYYTWKWAKPHNGLMKNVIMWSWKSARLAELMLNYAEAAAEAGHLAEAVEMVDAIRARVGMPGLASSGANVGDRADVILRVRNERRIELAQENIRYFDLRRWKSPDGDMSETCKYFTAMEITKTANTYGYRRVPINRTPRGGWENKYLLLPLPVSESTNMQGLTSVVWQNPGW